MDYPFLLPKGYSRSFDVKTDFLGPNLSKCSVQAFKNKKNFARQSYLFLLLDIEIS